MREYGNIRESNSNNNGDNIKFSIKCNTSNIYNMDSEDDMGLEKAIKSGKEHRDNYKYNFAKRVDRSCRNHGSCLYCEGNRRYRERRLKIDKKYIKEILTKDEI